MKALVKKDRSEGLTFMDVPKPAIGANDVLIEIKKTAICGTDIHIYDWNDWAKRTIPTPMVVGHEYSGVIKELGSEVKVLKLGARVTGEGHITCGVCRNCRAGRRHLCRTTSGVGVNRPGGFAEYLCLSRPECLRAPRQSDGRCGKLHGRPGKCHAHGPVLRPRGRGRAHHGCWPHRHHGRGDLQACGCAERCHHRHQRLPLELGAGVRCLVGHERRRGERWRHRHVAAHHEGARDDRGFRHGHGDVLFPVHGAGLAVASTRPLLPFMRTCWRFVLRYGFA
mmetsp:Transcript_32430/g.82303  ORF Transcript_32430/g.82303 Transcript_32430/m.82303 type:complete len:281 (-) Transcript_32430:167-1009(-)